MVSADLDSVSPARAGIDPARGSDSWHKRVSPARAGIDPRMLKHPRPCAGRCFPRTGGDRPGLARRASDMDASTVSPGAGIDPWVYLTVVSPARAGIDPSSIPKPYRRSPPHGRGLTPCIMAQSGFPRTGGDRPQSVPLIIARAGIEATGRPGFPRTGGDRP